MKQSKVVGFIRFYGRRVIRGWGRLTRAVAAMWNTHRKRTWWERSLLGLVAVGLVAGVGFSLLANLPFGVAPGGESPLHNQAAHDQPLNVATDISDRPALPQTQAPEVEADVSLTSGLLPNAIGSPSGVSQPLGAPDLAGLDSAGQGPQTSGSTDARTSGSDEASSNAPTGEQSASAPAPRSDVPVASVSSMEWPVVGGVLRPYGWYRHPVFGDWRHASAVVLQPTADHNVVTSALAGRVSEVVNSGGLWRVTIRHSDGWETEYEGLASVEVSSYEVVATGQVIGSAPDAALGGVAFAVYREGVAVDPYEILGEPIAMVGAP